jgi:hypothetical protein
MAFSKKLRQAGRMTSSPSGTSLPSISGQVL